MNVGGDLAKLVPGRVSTEVDARLAYDTHGIIRKVGLLNLVIYCFKGYALMFMTWLIFNYAFGLHFVEVIWVV